MICAFVSRQAHKGQTTMDQFESLNHTKWDCKYHVVFIPKYRRKAPVRRSEATPRSGIPATGRAEGKPRRRRAFDARPRSHVVGDTAEICGQSGGWLHQRQERDPSCASLRRTKARVRRTKLLGARVFRLDHRSRRSGHQGIFQEPGKRRSKVGTIEPVEVTCHLQVAHK